ncbi:MAG: GNAT family N-acetyltransferase, partial [Clostridia bacterium]|nr:GNAT family N-acetyltransferase [Clostridia bacterium]
MYIETERLIIRDFCEADAPTLYDIKYDEQVRYFCPDFLEVEVSLQDAQAYILKFNRYEAEHDIDAWRCYAIEYKLSHEVIGCLCFGLQDMLFEYELGWMMKRAFTKNGF